MKGIRLPVTAVEPNLLVNRDALRRSLADAISDWLGDPEAAPGASWTVLGDKGVGKTILTRAVLADVKSRHSADVLIVEADCRQADGWRVVVSAVARGLRKELEDMHPLFPGGLAAWIQLVDLLDRATGWGATSARVVRTHTAKLTGTLKVSSRFLDAFNADLSLGGEVGGAVTEDLPLNLDATRLTDWLVKLLDDLLRATGLRVVLFLDNVDELDHEYDTAEKRDRVRGQLKGLIPLHHARAAVVVNLRSYMSGILGREMVDRELVEALDAEHRLAVLDRRLAGESAENQRILAEPRERAFRAALAAVAPTPLALLTWYRVLMRHDALTADRWGAARAQFLKVQFGSIPEDAMAQLLSLFPTPGASIDLKALGALEPALLAQAQATQALLPCDFWNPVAYTLDPLLQVAHPGNLDALVSAG
jgi:hypothetical protein